MLANQKVGISLPVDLRVSSLSQCYHVLPFFRTVFLKAHTVYSYCYDMGEIYRKAPIPNLQHGLIYRY